MLRLASKCCTFSISSYNDSIELEGAKHMTRKHYEKVAEYLRAYHKEIANGSHGGYDINARLSTLEDVVEILGDIFYQDNPRFDLARFASACVPNELVGR
jgi:hypothetical protein